MSSSPEQQENDLVEIKPSDFYLPPVLFFLAGVITGLKASACESARECFFLFSTVAGSAILGGEWVGARVPRAGVFYSFSQTCFLLQ